MNLYLYLTIVQVFFAAKIGKLYFFKFTFFIIFFANYQFSKGKNANLVKPKMEWVYFDALAYRDPSFDKTSLSEINCQIASNIIYLEEKNINFERNYVMDFNNLDLSTSEKN